MLEQLLEHARDAVGSATMALLTPLPFFAGLALIVKGRRLFADVRRALPESRTNILIHFTDAILVAPILVSLSVGLSELFKAYDLALVPRSFWSGLHPVVVGIAAVFLGDFIGYWRHRLEHTPLLWPSHAVHHSDEEMTWLSVFRFHPINRLTTVAVDFAFILAMGLPAYAVLVNAAVRHYYGAFIHADLPWTFGSFGKVFVSPTMHRWHHSMDAKAYNTNYASVFSFIDYVFGTYRVPGPCNGPLGVPEHIAKGIAGQLIHPFKPASYRYFLRSIGRLPKKSA